jgi:hypothetical protein
MITRQCPGETLGIASSAKNLALVEDSSRLSGASGSNGAPQEGLRHPVSLYSFNVERVTTNPQSVIRGCKHLQIYYFKVEAGTLNRGGDAHTPAAIFDSEDVRVYCMYGNVRDLGDRPMLQISNSEDIAVSQLKAFRPATFPHLVEMFGGERHEISSSKTCALFLRDGKEDNTAK